MRSDKEPRTFYAFWLSLLGFVLGLLIVLIATGLAVYLRNLAISLDSVVQLHLTDQIFWVIDAVPFLAAVTLGIAGGRLDRLTRARWQTVLALHQRDAEIQRLTAEISAQEQAREQLDLTIGRGKRDWEATFDAVGDSILITDVSGKVLRCNRATSHAFREGFENLIGRQIDDLFFGALHGGQFPIPAQRTEMRFPKLDGWFEVSTNPIMVEEGRAATITVIRDVTDRKQAALDLSRQKEYYEALVRNSPFAIVTLNLDSRAVACNAAFEEIFGYGELDILGQEIDALITPIDLVAETRAMNETVKQGQVIHKITRRQRKDGKQLDVEVFGVPVVLWGKQIGILALYHDISKLVGPAVRSEASGADAILGAAVSKEAPREVPGNEIFRAAGVFREGRGSQQSERRVEVPAPLEAPASSEWEAPAGEAEDFAAGSAAPPMNQDPESLEALSEPNSQEAPPIEVIEGIGPAYSARLGEASIRSTSDLLEAGATRAGRKELAEKTGLSPKLILRWVNIADLIRIPGIGEEYSQLLEAAGVDTVKELRHRAPENLYQKMLEVNERQELVRRTPHLSEVEAWVEAARESETVIEY
jgi:PAS domain S-box-containing protein